MREGEEKRGRLTKLDVGAKRDAFAEKKETNVGEPRPLPPVRPRTKTPTVSAEDV